MRRKEIDREQQQEGKKAAECENQSRQAQPISEAAHKIGQCVSLARTLSIMRAGGIALPCTGQVRCTALLLKTANMGHKRLDFVIIQFVAIRIHLFFPFFDNLF